MLADRHLARMILTFFLFEFLNTAYSGEFYKYYAKPGFYLGAKIPQNAIHTNYDRKYIIKGQREILIPKVNNSYGFQILLGSRYDLSETFGLDYADVKEGATEISYMRSIHYPSQQGDEGKAVFNMLSLDLKMYFLARKRFQPFFLAGGGYSWLSLKDASSNSSLYNPTTIDEINFKGFGFNAGLGLAFFINPKVSISGEFFWRLFYYGETKSIERYDSMTKTTQDHLELNNRSFDVSIRYTF